jgi:cold shock CspA family protein
MELRPVTTLERPPLDGAAIKNGRGDAHMALARRHLVREQPIQCIGVVRCRFESRGDSMQFIGIVKSFDEGEGAGTIVRDRDKLEIPVRTAGLALGVSALFEGDRVQFDVDLGINPQARNVMLA